MMERFNYAAPKYIRKRKKKWNHENNHQYLVREVTHYTTCAENKH